MKDSFADNLSEAPALTEADSISLKILFGSMYGCEFHLPRDDYFFITNPGVKENCENYSLAETSKTGNTDFVYKTLYMPSNRESPNFLLKLKKDDVDECEVDIFYESDGVRSYTIKYNTLFSVGNICFAVKREGDVWDDSIISCRQNKAENKIINRLNILKSLSFLSIFIMLASFTLFIYKYNTDDKAVSLDTTLPVNASSLTIINSMDRHKTYLITKDESEMNFIQGGYAKVNSNMIAFYLPSLQKKIIDALYTAGKPVIQIDFSNPRNPSMYLYNSIPGDQIQAVKKFVMSQAPFIDDVKFIVYEKKILLTQAEQGLERLNIFFRLVSTTGGYALIVQSSLDDHQLFALNQFIKEFYNQWGNRIINFSISLDENFLHDKSYFESLSGEGYIFLSPHHWFFPLTEEEGYLKND
ncbi:TPA: hypothetical protein N3Z68_004709 [Salmonella enterica subsp. enterica serovar 16:l,v:-]|nr:hypothetical protein [Salmonella enterica subsp. enterica serovar 16:l,v:-]